MKTKILYILGIVIISISTVVLLLLGLSPASAANEVMQSASSINDNWVTKAKMSVARERPE